MLMITAKHKVYLAVQAIDFRCGIDASQSNEFFGEFGEWLSRLLFKAKEALNKNRQVTAKLCYAYP